MQSFANLRDAINIKSRKRRSLLTVLTPSGFFTEHAVCQSKIMRPAHTEYVFCVDQNQQRLFLYTALTGGFYSRYGVCT